MVHAWASDFAAEETTADRLALGYAVTVHRSQGATVDTAHRYEDGGREIERATPRSVHGLDHGLLPELQQLAQVRQPDLGAGLDLGP